MKQELARTRNRDGPTSSFAFARSIARRVEVKPLYCLRLGPGPKRFRRSAFGVSLRHLRCGLWIDVPNVDPGEDDTPVREQVIALGATPIQKAEGVWTGLDGDIWFVSSRGDGPDAEDEEDRSAAVHAGQIWRYSPRSQSIELVTVFPAGSPFDGPDNIVAGPHGFALACTDGEDEQFLVGINDDSGSFAFARNPVGDDEFAGATFSPDGQTLYVNIQAEPAKTFAVWGPWLR
jgi:secreted PhoX family phosphatase